jgi:Glycosyl hydrolases family 28
VSILVLTNLPFQIPGVGYVKLGEDRPRLFKVDRTSNILIENLVFRDSPMHTIHMEGIENVTIRHVSVVARRTHADGHNLIDMSALNTDGIDVSGQNVHVHDVDIWVQDDCIAVKDNNYPPYISSNMLFERVNCSGLGLVIGSIAGTQVSNITFRDAYLHKPFKGIYTKFREPSYHWKRNHTTHNFRNHTTYGSISNVLYENIVMEAPIQWPIWIGPAQQSDQEDPCFANPCSLCWPQDPFSECKVVPSSMYHNITLSNIQINNPGLSPGVILGGDGDRPTIDTIVFHNVQVTYNRPVPAALQFRNVSFPGLNQPIRDKYVPIDQVQQISSVVGLSGDAEALYMGYISTEQIPYPMFGLLIAIFILASAIYWIWKYLNKCVSGIGVSSRSKRRSIALLGLAFVLIQTMILLSVVGQGWITPRFKQKSRYFRCEGVVNGIAKGGTNPVPYCFHEVE